MSNTTFVFVPDENKPLSENMQELYKCEILNGDRHLFGQVDIAFQQFIEKGILTQREKDLIHISSFFHFAWKTVHIQYRCLGEELTASDFDIVQSVFYALERQNLIQVMLDDLSLSELKSIIFR